MRARVFLIALLVAAPLFAADDFYEQQLRAGKADFQASRLPQAADEFRIAAFGLMQQPPLLQESLARLAVAQNALGQTDEVKKTLDRFIDVEQRFAPYQNVELEPSVRSKFEELIVKQIPRPTLQAIPSLARLANYDFLKIAQMSPAQRITAYEEGAQREPKNPEWTIALTNEAAARDNANDVIRWGTKVLELDPANKDVKPLLAHARSTRRECKEALAIINDADAQQHPELYADQTVCFTEMGRWKEAETALAKVPEKLKSRPDVQRAAQRISAENTRIAKLVAPKPALSASEGSSPAGPPPSSAAGIHGAAAVPQTSSAQSKPAANEAAVLDATRKLIKEGRYEDAVKTLRAAVQKDAENRTLKLALLEASVLARDWRTAASQVPLVTPLTPGEELYMFYASVALYETGRHDEAKLFMEKARPRMVPSPMVDYYVKIILGQQRGS